MPQTNITFIIFTLQIYHFLLIIPNKRKEKFHNIINLQ